MGIVTPLNSANARASTDRWPATKVTSYALPREVSILTNQEAGPVRRLRERGYIEIVSRSAHRATVELVGL